VDLVAGDISIPLREQGGAILEVNPMPGFTMHTTVPVADLIVSELHPDETNGRIPIAAVHGSGETTIARRIHMLLRNRGVFAGGECAEGTIVGDEFAIAGLCRAPNGAGLLLHPRIEAAVFETSERAIMEEGLAFDACDVLVLAASPSLTRGARLLLDCVVPGGVAFVPDSVRWRDEAAGRCRSVVRTYTECPGWEVSVARAAADELADRFDASHPRSEQYA
jgi:hypothetical protein